jgi:cytochrome c5
MKRQTALAIGILLFALLAVTVLAACGTSSPTAAPAASSSGGSGTGLDGQTLMEQRCSVCHSTDRITSAHKTADQWKTTVERMVSHGSQLDAQEQQTLIDYLAQTYP